jgi:hypothetical protein
VAINVGAVVVVAVVLGAILLGIDRLLSRRRG